MGEAMSASGWIHLDVEEIVRETPKAFLLRIADGEELWVPKSVVQDANDYSEGDCDCCVSVSEWFCEKEGLL